VDQYDALDWMRKRLAWEHWLNDLHRGCPERCAETGPDAPVATLRPRRRHHLPALVHGERWHRRSA
jgi:hypothetical protein